MGFQFVNWSFSIPTDLISLSKTSIKTFPMVLEYIRENHCLISVECNLSAPEKQESSICIDKSRFSKLNFFTVPVSFSHQSVNQKVFLLDEQKLPLEKKVFLTLQANAWLSKSGKNAIGIDTCRCSNSFFSQTTALNSCVKVWTDGAKLTDDS